MTDEQLDEINNDPYRYVWDACDALSRCADMIKQGHITKEHLDVLLAQIKYFQSIAW